MGHGMAAPLGTLPPPQILFSGAAILVPAVKGGHPGKPGFCFALLTQKLHFCFPRSPRAAGHKAPGQLLSLACGAQRAPFCREVRKAGETPELDRVF